MAREQRADPSCSIKPTRVLLIYTPPSGESHYVPCSDSHAATKAACELIALYLWYDLPTLQERKVVRESLKFHRWNEAYKLWSGYVGKTKAAEAFKFVDVGVARTSGDIEVPVPILGRLTLAEDGQG
jgi:hypothetical protein